MYGLSFSARLKELRMLKSGSRIRVLLAPPSAPVVMSSFLFSCFFGNDPVFNSSILFNNINIFTANGERERTKEVSYFWLDRI